ncbi:MAG: AMMECR1 domain-containing protein [Deltaproteobacteria bacterium]|nr:AMMECR1 domain-containing protein [Deltaproteobacteria bacterium]
MKKYYSFIILVLSCLSVSSLQAETSVFLQSEIKNLFQQYFKKEPLGSYAYLEKTSAGIFVTLEENNRTLACLGDVRPHHKNLKEELIGIFDKILSHPRFSKALQPSDYLHWSVWVRFPKTPLQVHSIYQINPKLDGAMLKSGAKASMALPGEAKTQKYLLRLLKSKAGLTPQEPFTLYRIHAPGFKL